MARKPCLLIVDDENSVLFTLQLLLEAYVEGVRFEICFSLRKERVLLNRIIFLIFISTAAFSMSAVAQDVTGDWIGQMNSGFTVRIHIEKVGSRLTGKLINPSGNGTVLDQVTSDGTHLHFMVTKLSLTYDGVWSGQEKIWNGNLTFQQVYPLA